MESSWAEKHSLRRSATMNDTLCCALHCPCAVDCSALHGIGHNSKYLGLAVDTLCHTKSWWTQGSHPHSFYTHSSTQEKAKWNNVRRGKRWRMNPVLAHVMLFSCDMVLPHVLPLTHKAGLEVHWSYVWVTRLDFYRIDWYTIQYAMTCSCDDI